MLEMDSGDSRPPRAARALHAVALLDGLASGSNAAGCFADRSAAVGSATEQQRAWRVGRRPDASWTLGLDWASGDGERGFERLTTRPARAPLDGCSAVAPLGGGGASGRPAALHALRLELSMRRPSGGEGIGRPSRTDVDHHAVVTRARRVALRQRRRRLLVIHLGTSSRSQ